MGSVTTTVPDFTFQAGFGISVDTTSANKHVEFTGSGVDVTIAGQTLQGDFTVEQRPSGNQTTVTVGATHVNVSLAGGAASISEGSGGFILSSAGFAGSAGGTLHLAAGGVSVQGDFRLDVNETTDPIDKTIDTSNGTVQLSMPAGKFIRFEGTGTSLDFGNVFLGGNFTFQSATENNQSVVTVGVDSATAFIGTGYGTANETGAKVSSASGGILITNASVRSTFRAMPPSRAAVS